MSRTSKYVCDRPAGDFGDRAIFKPIAELAEGSKVLRVADELARDGPLLHQRARAAVANRPDRELEAAHAARVRPVMLEAALQAGEGRERGSRPLIDRAEVQDDLLGEAVRVLRVVAVALRHDQVVDVAIHEREQHCFVGGECARVL